ncbi:histidine kinase [Pelagicoccus sp. SDUM812003]|uniref:sensor histidine kinase n=1 Tax=Pelagicoccus sp. SDUM812003 TaxID=3041267 RepID=UPI00280DA2B6|nr:histidine kinase [Pelagicoccus sp. SDUM812003]MDQ8202470.1 histidine kinase [Pelagicoccus sp. SDUM812003]
MSPRRSPLRAFLLLFALWTAIGLSFASQFYLSSSLSGYPVTWSQALSYSLVDWYVWAALSVGVLALCRRYPIERLRWSNPLLIHLIASTSIALLYAFIRALVAQAQSWLIGDPASYVELIQPLLFKTYHFNFIVYWVIAAIAHAASYYRKFHERERSALDLERRLTEARLQALQAQLNPHFLFNAMHSISALMHKDVDAADSMLAKLSDLLRLSLKKDKNQTIPLSEEITFLQSYLDIERIRFGDRLATEFDIPAELHTQHVPSFILQPIVENALKHGIAPYARPGKLTISARASERSLQLEVKDNGGGLADHTQDGIGLSNTKTRLSELYGDRQSFSITQRPEGGVRVLITLPLSD